MNQYLVEEKVQMVCWVMENYSLRQVRDLFSVKYPNRPIPCIKTIQRTFENFKTYGCVNGDHLKHDFARHERENYEQVINVLAAVENNPNISLRRIESEGVGSRSSVQRILKKHKFKSYRYSKAQELIDGDQFQRMQFCETMTEKLNRGEILFENCIFTDECSFPLIKQPHNSNFRYWSRKNPHLYVQNHTQYYQSVNVWAGILGNNIIGPYFIDGTLNFEKYRNLLINEVLPNIAEVTENEVWFQQDGAPAHSARQITELLNNTFHEKWIGRYGPIKWPARSPDLSPNDFFLWGNLHQQVYNQIEKYPNVMALKDKIVQSCFNITPRQLSNVRNSFLNRLGYCSANYGGHFENLL